MYICNINNVCLIHLLYFIHLRLLWGLGWPLTVLGAKKSPENPYKEKKTSEAGRSRAEPAPWAHPPIVCDFWA